MHVRQAPLAGQPHYMRPAAARRWRKALTEILVTMNCGTIAGCGCLASCSVLLSTPASAQLACRMSCQPAEMLIMSSG
jgi:hypothetical protein